jgi:hypothetical protein
MKPVAVVAFVLCAICVAGLVCAYRFLARCVTVERADAALDAEFAALDATGPVSRRTAAPATDAERPS